MNKYIDRERYLTDCRDSAARGRIRKRQLTREERAYRKCRIVYLLSVIAWAAFIVLILFCGTPKPKESDESTPKKVPPLVQTVPTQPVAGEVEAVSMEYDPVREDIPLDAEIQRLLYKACGETGIRYELALAVIWQETDFRNIAGDGGESVGYMQVQEKHHRGRMERLGVTDLADPYSNYLVGCDYLAEMISEGKGLEWALMAYNGGPTYANNMAEAGKISQYVKDVLNYMNILTTEDF